MTRSHPSSPSARTESILVGGCMVAAASGAAVAGCQPTGLPVADMFWSALLAVSVTYASSRAHRRSWLVLAGLTLAASSGTALLAGAVAVVAAVIGTTARRRSPSLGAAIGAVSIQALLRLDLDQFHGASALVVALAVTPVLVSGYGAMSPRIRRRVRRTALGLGAAAAGATAIFVIGVVLARHDIDDGVSASRVALDSTREGRSDEARSQLSDAIDSLGSADRLLNSVVMVPARAVPIVGAHAEALGRLSRDGVTLSRAARHTIGAVDYDLLRYQSGQFDLARLARSQVALHRAATAAAKADDDLRTFDDGWLVDPLRDRMSTYRADVARARRDAQLAAELADVAPDMLGASGERHYFVAFVTPAELRGSGGFIGSYGELSAIGGRVRLVRSGPISDLINAAPRGSRTLTGPADYLARYGQYAPADYFQDVTYSPDFAADAEVIEQLYPQSGGTTVDGVLQVDPYGLAALLKFTGPITVEGIPEPMTSGNAAKILLEDQYRLFGRDADQNDALADAARTTFEKLTTGDLPSPRDLGRTLGPMVQTGRFKFHSVDEREQRLVERLGLAWTMPPRDGHDLIGITTQNTGNDKIDVFLHRTIDYRVHVDPATGDIDATAKVRLENRAPAAGLPAAVIGNKRGLPPGTSRLWLALYSPLTIDRAKIGTFTLPLTHGRERGYAVASQFLDVRPGGVVEVTFTLHGHTANPARYELDVFPQATVNPDRFIVTIDGGRPATAPAPIRASGPTATVTVADGRRHSLVVAFAR